MIIKKTIQLALLISFAVASVAQAFEIVNNTSYSITLSDFHFISGIEIYKFPVNINPGSTHRDNNIKAVSASVTGQPGTYRFRALTDKSTIYFVEVNGDISSNVQTLTVVRAE